ncbi:DegT/DnrJ/EryC1/StrS family aminotransferase [Streptomyces sp. G44]|uniref:aminotransferase class I/II-fold pyridoxal phosphate-dependent enzyme n=1 Tax=Streptomyces sp. G44 TaxID=2807632 RepID=UPI001960BDB5|nr:aminotransferase class I/II-fold pyridoxal phosphate-dependent enzyme [Streptomyces sp. G44]MBM7168581.1 DegT/DnrJ/EryC1/StrS family aminotransferase [Streptomyces sp. G44]
MQSHHLRRLLVTEPSLRHTASATAVGRVAHAARLRSVVARLARVEHAPLLVTETRASVRDGLHRERLVLDSPLRGPFPGTLLAPPGVTRGPAVLVLGGRNARLDQLTGDVPPDHPDRNVAEHLARAGFVTLSFDHGIGGGLDEERRAGRDEGTLLAHAFALTGRSLLGALVGDALGALDVLAAHPLVDPGRLGLFGHSLGAAVALHAALLAPREALPLCAASHLGSYQALYARLLTGHEGAALPGILEYADLADLYSALAPAPLQLQYGTADAHLEPADARAAADTVRAAFAAAGAPVEIHELAMGHGTHVGHAANFFARSLAGDAVTACDVPAQRIRFEVSERRAVLDRVDAALASGVLTQGPQVARFEELARTWTGTETVAVASGSAALEIALRIVGVAGRTVLVPVNTFFATAASAVRAGAAVRFVDIEPDGLGMDPDALRAALDRHPDTAVVLPVHIGGIVSPALHAVLAHCHERGVPVVEDAAHAFGATLDGRPAGSFGRFGAFSFFPTKVAVSGDGGLLSAALPDDLEQVRRWRDHGKSAQGSTLRDRPGGNWRLSELHAAVGTVDLERFANTLAARRERAGRYDALLADVPGIRPHAVPDGSDSNFYKYLAHLVPDGALDRTPLKKRLRERHGVSLAGEVYDHLLCDHPYFTRSGRPGRADGPFERARRFARHHIALPLYPSLTEAEQLRVVAALRSELP